MTEQPQKPPYAAHHDPADDDGRGPAGSREDLNSLLERLIALGKDNLDLQRKFAELPDETAIQDFQLKIAQMKQWLGAAKEKMHMPVPCEPEAGDGARREKISSARFPSAEKSAAAAPKTQAVKTPAPAPRAIPAAPLRVSPAPAAPITAPAAPPSGHPPVTDAARPPEIGADTAQKALSENSSTAAGEARRNPVKIKLAISGLATAVLLGCFLFIQRSSGKPPLSATGPNPLALAAANPVGLVYHNDSWLSVDWMNGRLFELNLSNGVKLIQAFPNSFPTGLSAGNNCLWSTDAFNRRCYRHDPKNFAIQASFPAPGPAPGAIYWDGASLWLSDKETRRVYKYLNIQGNAAALIHYPLLETDPAGLWRTEDLLWVLDRAKKTVRRYRIGKELVPADMLDMSGWLPPKVKPAGMALSGAELWLLTENPCFLYRYELGRIKWTPDRGPGTQSRGPWSSLFRGQ